jgi:hypothetical protein
MIKDEEKKETDAQIIDRLINEQNQTREVLNQVRQELYNDSEFDGLSLIGGIKTLKRRYYEERAKVERLNKELDKMLKDHLKEQKRISLDNR